MAHPVVVHALGVLGVTHKTANVQPSLNLKLVAHAADHGDVCACPIGLLQNLVAVDLEPFDFSAVGLARLDRLAEHALKHLVLGRARKRGLVAGVQVERLLFVLNVEILGNPHRVLVHPLAKALVAHTQRLQRGDGRGVRVLALVLVAGDVLSDEAPAGVGAARVLDQRVHVDREAVANAPNLDVLIERVVVAILGQDAGVALTVGHLVLAGCVVGDIRVRHVLDVPDHAVENRRHLSVSALIYRDDLGLRSVLPLLVGHLVNVLGQLVDGQARAGVDRLALHGATSGKHIGGPLPLVVGRPGVKPQVV